MYSYSYSLCRSGERCGPRASCYLYNILFMNNCGLGGGGLLCRLILCYDPLMTSSTVHIVHCYKYRLLLFLIFSIHLLKRFRFGDDDKSKLCMVNQCSLFRSKNIFFQFQTSILAISLLKNLSPCPF